MKKLMKIMGIIIVTIIVLETNVSAFSIETETEIDVAEYGYLPFHYIGEEKEKYEFLRYNGELVYSFSRNNKENNILINGTYRYNDNELEDIMMNSYPVKTYTELGLNNEEEAYFATQEAIYAYWERKEMSKYVAEDEQGERILKCVENILNAKSEKMITLTEVDSEWKVFEDDENYIYKNYYVTADPRIENTSFVLPRGTRICSQENKDITTVSGGETIKFVVSRYSNRNCTLAIKFNVESYKMYSIYNDSNINKAYLLMKYEYSQSIVNMNIKVNNVMPVKIVNYDGETNEVIQGNMFNILDKNGNAVESYLTTNKDGKISVYLEEGEYFLKQTEAKEGYSIMKEMIGFSVKKDEEVNLNIYSATTTEKNINKLTSQINVTEETQKTVENDVTNITNIKTTNTIKEVIKQTNETNLNNNNRITNTIYQKTINQLFKDNTYNNKTWEENIEYYMLDETNETSNMSRDDFMKYIDFVKSGSIEVPNLPVASK